VVKLVKGRIQPDAIEEKLKITYNREGEWVAFYLQNLTVYGRCALVLGSLLKKPIL